MLPTLLELLLPFVVAVGAAEFEEEDEDEVVEAALAAENPREGEDGPPLPDEDLVKAFVDDDEEEEEDDDGDLENEGDKEEEEEALLETKFVVVFELDFFAVLFSFFDPI